MKTVNYGARQGDVVILRADILNRIPANKKKINSPILVSGEATGHAHRITDFENANVFVDESGAVCCVENTAPTTIDHEEHGNFRIAPKKWEVILQREYSPEENRRVID